MQFILDFNILSLCEQYKLMKCQKVFIMLNPFSSFTLLSMSIIYLHSFVLYNPSQKKMKLLVAAVHQVMYFATLGHTNFCTIFILNNISFIALGFSFVKTYSVC